MVVDHCLFSVSNSYPSPVPRVCPARLPPPRRETSSPLPSRTRERAFLGSTKGRPLTHDSCVFFVRTHPSLLFGSQGPTDPGPPRCAGRPLSPGLPTGFF